MPSDSDHDQARPAGVPGARHDPYPPVSATPRVRILGPTQTGYAHEAALAAVTVLDETVLRSLSKSCRAVHDVALLAPSHSICVHHEGYLQQLVLDLFTLGQWAQTALVALRDAERATSPGASARPSAEAPTPAPHASQPARLLSPPATLPASSPAPEEMTACPATPAVQPPAGTLLKPRRHRNLQPQHDPSEPPTHVTVRLRYLLNKPQRPHPSHIRAALNKVLGGEAVSAIRYSKDGSLILHAKAPYTVEQLLSRRVEITKCLSQRLCYSHDPPAFFDTGGAWSKVVIHRAPLPVHPAQPGTKQYPERVLHALVDDLSRTNNIDPDTIRDIRLLCPPEDEAKRLCYSEDDFPSYESILICIADADTANRLLKEGITVQHMRCRVTPYRPRC
ncbi:hypothetical protein EXIGLDRAFT_764237 [Exidia glandulosa HHB12029]|uniref:Uncharacterized protein n=1 Tax=Exidia glandulosa HHB12029 TaxID=1314781 RepID=A0A165L9Z6_EXIGL|nr:hypothetical protein EXIGLDRAFT_764237 [Exidia glandulosa HHB12029]